MNTTNKPAEIRHRLWMALEQSPFVMIGLNESSDHSIPMTAILDSETDAAIWFYTGKDNRLASGGEAMMQFCSNKHDLFACVRGKLVEETDESFIDKHWSNAVAAWFEKGRQDPDLLMLRFELGDAEIWEADPGVVGSFKLLTGVTMKPDEAGGHARISM